jgi:DNA-binding XRE family transcriptional regulator
MEKKTLKMYSLEEVTQRYIGKEGTPKRDAFENELKLELMGETLKKIRIEKNLTQEQLGEMIGVQKSQIEKLENNFIKTPLDIILKTMKALNAYIHLEVEFEKK